MYTEFFGLNEKPFSITPDPRYLYLTDRHADALAHLIYGISESGGFIQLTGEVGTGKTTLIRSLLEQMPTDAKVAVILNPNLTAREFLAGICEELHIPLPQHESKSALVGALNHFLLNAHAEGTRVVLIVDEAQTLDAELLEQVRLLTNLETAKQKLLQIILIGQPELRDLLNRPDMRQVAQRVTGRFHLEPLSRAETAVYVAHRMKVAGAQGQVFKPSAMRELFRRSSGIPRLINVVADRALLAGFTLDSTKIDGKLVRRAAKEVFGGRHQRRWWPYPVFAALLGVAAALWVLRSPVPAPMAPAIDIATTSIDEPRLEAELTPQAVQRPSATADLFPPGVDAARDAGSEAAYRDLLRAWGASVEPAIRPACAQAVVQQLNCLFFANVPIAKLHSIEKPIVVSLTGPDGRRRDVLLTALETDAATLTVAGQQLVVMLDEFESLWSGSYVALWRPYSPSQDVLKLGSEGEDVIWLRRALSSVYGQPLSEHDRIDEFDSELEGLVRRYQRDRALTVDGVVGRQTQTALTADLGIVTANLLGRRG